MGYTVKLIPRSLGGELITKVAASIFQLGATRLVRPLQLFV